MLNVHKVFRVLGGRVCAVVEQPHRRTGQPAGKTRASYRIGDVDLPYPGAWVESADMHTDSWSPGVAAWR